MILKNPSLQHKTTLHIVHETNKQTSITYNTWQHKKNNKIWNKTIQYNITQDKAN